MKKVLIACVFPKDTVPNQRFRFEQYLDYLSQTGFEIVFSSLLTKEDYSIYFKKGYFFKKGIIVLKGFFKRYRQVKSASKYDLIFIPRESFMLGTSWFEKQFAKKSKLIFDFDDAIWITYSISANRRFKFLKNPNKTAQIIRIADLIFAGNDYLANYAKQFNKNVVVIPTTIDTFKYQNDYKENKDKICIGWSGSFSTIVDFKTCIGALKILKNKYGSKIYFKVIGDANYKNEELNIDGYPWIEKTEVNDLKEIDIGIMPLPDTEWARGKCGLKGLQYMTLSIPTVMSPVGVNSKIIQDGVNGFLASGIQEWVEKLSLLIDSAQLRDQIGQNGRNTVVAKYSVKATEELYLQYFKEEADKSNLKFN